jgi:hypothetical protein
MIYILDNLEQRHFTAILRFADCISTEIGDTLVITYKTFGKPLMNTVG